LTAAKATTSFTAEQETIHIFNVGYGSDTINDSEGINTISFGNGITSEAMTAYRTNWNDLTITFDGTDDRLVIQGYFSSENNRNFNVTFADGTRYAFDDTENPIKQVHATEYDDWMSAWSDNGIVFYGDGGNDTYVFGRNYGTDIIEDYDGNNKVVLSGIDPNEVTFAKTNQSELTVSINGCEDKLTIRNFNSESFTFEFAGGVSGTVNAETAVFTEIIPEEEIIQSNAKLLSDIYSDESMSSDLLTEISDTVLIDSSSAVSAAKETEETADQTDIQVIILTENMSAFGRSKS